MAKRLILIVVLGLAAVVAAVMWQGGAKGRHAEKLSDELRSKMGSVAVYQDNAAYLDALMKLYQDEAYERSFSGRTVNVTQFHEMLLGEMIAHAKRDEAEHVAQGLERFMDTGGYADEVDETVEWKEYIPEDESGG